MSTQDRVKLCENLLAQGKTQREICSLLKMSPALVTAIRNGRRTADSPGRGRPVALTREMLRFAEEIWAVNSLVSDEEMATMINSKFGTNVSRATMQRRRRELRFEYRPPKVRQHLTDEQKQVRIEFCKFMLERRESFSSIVFSDESRFCRGPDNKWRRIKRDQWNETCFCEKEKFSAGLMVWGAVARGYRTPLISCSNHMDAREYVNVLQQSEMITKMRELRGDDWAFMQDGAPCHTSALTFSFLQREKVTLVPGWPANSPDLNPIEMIWGILKRRIAGYNCGAADFARRLTELWVDLDRIVIDSLVDSFYERCELVLRLDGASLTPYLQAHRPGPPSVIRYTRDWRDEDDQRLLRLWEEHGPKWKLIARISGEEPYFVKYRVNRARQIALKNGNPGWVQLPSITDFDFPFEDVPDTCSFLQLFS